MSVRECLFIAKKYNLVEEIKQELASGKSPEQALYEWDIL